MYINIKIGLNRIYTLYNKSWNYTQASIIIFLSGLCHISLRFDVALLYGLQTIHGLKWFLSPITSVHIVNNTAAVKVYEGHWIIPLSPSLTPLEALIP